MPFALFLEAEFVKHLANHRAGLLSLRLAGPMRRTNLEIPSWYNFRHPNPALVDAR